MTRPTLHLVGLPHTTTTTDITVCAYTAKYRKLCHVLDGWEVIQYWGDRTDAPCRELVRLHTEEERLRWYPGLTPETVATVGGSWDSTMESWQTMNARAVAEIGKRVGRHDIILLAGGFASKPVADAFPGVTVCEPGVGYTGWFANYVCFESHTWRHHCYGVKGIHDGRFYDTVIGNYFEPDAFPLVRRKQEYLLFVGRLIRRKGVEVAAAIARRSGMPLYVAGPEAQHVTEGLIVCNDGSRIQGDVHYLGVLDAADRAKAMGEATALLAPTLYIEPFGGVAVEAQLCGTPAITTNWGAFTETVEDQYRFNTVPEAVACVDRARRAKPKMLRDRAIGRWSLDAVRPLYDRWLDSLDGLWAGRSVGDFYGD